MNKNYTFQYSNSGSENLSSGLKFDLQLQYKLFLTFSYLCSTCIMCTFDDVIKKRGRYRVENFQNHKLLKILSVPIDTNVIKQMGLSLTHKLRYKSEILSTNFHQRKWYSKLCSMSLNRISRMWQNHWNSPTSRWLKLTLEKAKSFLSNISWKYSIRTNS